MAADRPRVSKWWSVLLLLCVLLLVISIVSWARRSWYTGVAVRVWPGDGAADRKWIAVFGSNHGSLYAGLSHHNPVIGWVEFQSNSFGPTSYSPFASSAGFGLIWDGRYHTIFIPWWFAAAASTLGGAVSLRRIARSRSSPQGHCRRCGYDLRATPERCPECGTDVAQCLR